MRRRSLLAATAAGSFAAPGLRAAQDRSFDSAGVPIRFIEDGRGPPVIMVHGYTSNIERGFVQTGIFPAVAQGHRAIAIDARGHGRSGKPHDRAAYGPEMGRDVTRLMDHLGIAKAHVVGYSMGAHIVAQLAILDPGRFLTLTLGGAAGRLGWTAEDQRRVDEESAEMDQGLLRSQFLRLWPRDRPPPSEAEIRADSERRLAGQDPRALAAVRRSNPDQVVPVERLAAVPMPTLGIVGTADPYLRDFERLKAAMPRLELVTIAGASHGSAPGTPEFRAALVRFLQAHPAG
ncbi:alpha/beta hydrolase [Roseomonas sp. PWR1]|uniref:Alpha/beta hydrolase n=1 Tax=Roseomonas nitratireducens TaxID=2820810 RepID=A0ABS4APZ6_9PROT|nr:alpha/beta hydrolase [Neoroseomonas nitratireducens]MBP0463430.1 alpha/beta hydrolase [Neoroseomonas nitratireducens]